MKARCPKCDGEFMTLKNGGLRAHGPVHSRCSQDASERTDYTECDGCDKKFTVRAGESLPVHGPVPGTVCTQRADGGFEDPTDTAPEKGPWFGAIYGGQCSSCEDWITDGDRIRADGSGGYECEACDGVGDELDPEQPLVDGWQTQASAAAKRHVAANQADTPVAAVYSEPTPEAVQDAMPFEDPTTPAERPKKINVSGQPEADRDWLGRYIVKDPELGDFRRTQKGKPFGITRVTTFNKAAQDSKAINDWGKRNVVIGASLRPDILRRAHGLVHETGRDALDRIVADLDTAAGGKVSADEGTYLHEETEFIDAGLKTWRDSPPAYQQDLKRYVEALAEAGLEPVPGLIERTTMVSEFGGVCGTFDRVFYHRPSGSYVIGDLKTGKTMKYAMDETETQLWCYAHGVNQNGVYDWNTKTWTREDISRGGLIARVREDVGVIIHMPVQGPEAGTVNVLLADLTAGGAHAELCHAVRSRPKRKPVPWASWTPPEPPAPLPWGERFAAVRDKEHATELWREAKAAGVHPMTIQDLVRIAREALAGKG
jgi:hypothetical protein